MHGNARKLFLLVSVAVIKHGDQRQLGEERVHFILQLLGHTPSLTEVEAQTPRQEPKQKP